MKLLFDSHVLYWTLYEPERLTERVKNAVSDQSNQLFVSLATVWELGNKAAAYRLPAAGSSVDLFVDRIEELDVTFLPILRKEIISAAHLPQHHADPFDRMLIAQAQTNGLTLLTKNKDIPKYDVSWMW